MAGELLKNGDLSERQLTRASDSVREALLLLAPLIPRTAPNSCSAVLACLEGEFHEVGLLTVALSLEADGWNVHSLGVNTPADILSSFVRIMEPDLVCISTSAVMEDQAFRTSLHQIREAAHAAMSTLILGGCLPHLRRGEELYCDESLGSLREMSAYLRNRFFRNRPVAEWPGLDDGVAVMTSQRV
jgi:methanogenic corrinoid protein MtbC1